MATRDDDSLELELITDQIAVQEAGEAPKAPEQESGLEVDEITPLPAGDIPPEAAEPRSEPRRGLRLLLLLGLVVLVAGTFLLGTDTGRRYLPAGVKKHVVKERPRKRRPRPKQTFYTFTDEQGVVHIVDSLTKVPKKYRAQAKKVVR